MAASSSPNEGSISLLPDSLLVSIINRAVSITPALLSAAFDSAPYSHRPVACFRALAQLRFVSIFRKLTLHVEGIFLKVDEGSANDARVVKFLHEAENDVRTVHVAYPVVKREARDRSEDYYKPREVPKLIVSGGFLAGVLCVAPRLQHFTLSWGKLAGAEDPDNKVQALFSLLAQCSNLESINFEKCHLSIRGPICQLPNRLKELHLSVLKSITNESLVALVQAAPNLEILYIHIDGDLNVDLVTKIHSQNLVHLFLDYESDRCGLDDEARCLIRRNAVITVDIKTPSLKILHINLDGRGMKIDAPRLSSLTLYGDYPGPFTVAQKWDLERLTLTEATNSKRLLPLLEACHCLEYVDLAFTSLNCHANTGAPILALLQGVVELKINASALKDMQADMPEGIRVPPFLRLAHLTIDVEEEGEERGEELEACEGFLRACPNIIQLQVESYGGPLLNTHIQQLWERRYVA